MSQSAEWGLSPVTKLLESPQPDESFGEGFDEVDPKRSRSESTGRVVGDEFTCMACRRAVLNPPPAPLSVVTDWERPDDPDWLDEYGGELTGISPEGASRLLAFAGESLATAKLIL